MARANLHILSEVKERFLQAQEERNVRILKVKIQGEDIIVDQAIERVGSAQEDFDTLLQSNLVENQASFALFCLTDDPIDTLTWVLIAWVPEGCRVRDKMLYSSSREDLRMNIGLGYFKGDYPANQYSDLVWTTYLESQNKEFTADVLTETERLVLEEKTLTQAESHKVKSSALGVLPFEVDADVQSSLAAFPTQSKVWLDLTLRNEVVHLVNSYSPDADTDFSTLVNQDAASFILTKLVKSDGSSVSLFIYYCPDTAPVRSKMTMSSSKSTVVGLAAQSGIAFDKTFEVRDSSELADTIKSILNAEESASEVATTSSSSAANLAHSKPSRPGRGKAKVTKFTADEN